MGSSGFDINQSVVIKEENLFCVSEPDGSMPGPGPHPFGLYYEDCRFLCGWELEVLGEPPRALACTARDGHLALYDLTNGDITVDGRPLPSESLQIQLERELSRPRTIDERIAIRSFVAEPIEVHVRLALRAGFEPMLWIRGLARDFTPRRPKTVARPAGLRSSARGRDGVERRLETLASPRPRATRGALEWKLRLRRGVERRIALRHVFFEDGPAKALAPPPLRPRRRRHRTDAHGSRSATVRSDSELFNRVLARALDDLRLLRSKRHGEHFFAGGVPWYATLFGRDTLITAIEMLAYDHEIAAETLRLLARRLGKRCDDAHDEEPGKVVHELRIGEIANLHLSPFARYYGSVDGTLLFLCLLGEHLRWSGDLSLFEELSGEVDAALEWIERYGDLDGDGLLEYQRRAPEGLRNQGWKDSEDGVPDARGVPLRSPVALVEAQAYAVLAKRRLAEVYELVGDAHRARSLRCGADELCARLDRFWLADRSRYAMALDAGKRPTRVLASNQGHLLWAMCLSPKRARAVRDALMDPQLFCGWGVRTLGTGEVAFNPLGYHTGAVWPHDCALIATGLRGYGYDSDFARIFEGLVEAATRLPDFRLPELFAGFSIEQYDAPVPYPSACHPQAWAAASIPYLLTSALGLLPQASDGSLRVVRPVLPRWVDELEVCGLRVGGARADLRFERSGDTVSLADVRVDGELDVVLDSSRTRHPDLDGVHDR